MRPVPDTLTAIAALIMTDSCRELSSQQQVTLKFIHIVRGVLTCQRHVYVIVIVGKNVNSLCLNNFKHFQIIFKVP